MTGTFVVPGVPQAKQRARKGAQGRWYTPEATRNAENGVALLCRYARLKMGSADAVVYLTFSVSKRSGDLDNEIKLALDGITKGGGWDDDKQVVEVHARYEFVEPGNEQTLIVVVPA